MKSQQGVTLVGLMVGITISAFVLLAMLTIYQNALSRVAISTASAADNTARASGIMLANRTLQSAGFGIDEAQPPQDLLRLSSLRFAGNALSSNSTAPTPRATRTGATPPDADGGDGTHLSSVIIWGMNISTGSRCQALASAATNTGHGLLHLTSHDACTSAQNDWDDLNWSARPLAWHPYLAIDGLAPDSDQWIGLTLNNADCWPFGLPPADGHAAGAYSVTLSYPIFNVNEIAKQAITNTTCLVNFQL